MRFALTHESLNDLGDLRMKFLRPLSTALLSFTLAPIALSASEVTPNAWDWDFGAYAIYDSHDFDGTLFVDEDITKTNTSYLRRLKADAEVEYREKWSFAVALEYRELDNETQVDDFHLNYVVNDHIEFTIGKFKEPLGLENQMSLRYQPLTERSATSNIFLFGRNTGIAFDIEHDTWTMDLAMTYQKAPANQHRDSIAHIARITYAPIQKKKQFLHFGLDLSARQGTELIYDINEPLIANGVGNLIHTPNFFANEIKLTGLEFAARYKPLLLMTEYYEQRIKQPYQADQTLRGAYVTAAYTLFGNSRTYQHGKLKLRGKKDHTLEVAARYTNTKLTPVFTGDDATVTSIALNYFFKKTARLSLEYEDADVTRNGRRNTDDLSGKSLNARIQLSY